VVDETYATDPTAYNLTAFEEQFGLNGTSRPDLPFLVNHRIFREDGLLSATLGLDWFEGAIAHPELVLKDMVSALHPTSTLVSPPIIATANLLCLTVSHGALQCPFRLGGFEWSQERVIDGVL
jgi:hypothetical protein